MKSCCRASLRLAGSAVQLWPMGVSPRGPGDPLPLAVAPSHSVVVTVQGHAAVSADSAWLSYLESAPFLATKAHRQDGFGGALHDLGLAEQAHSC